VGRIEKQINGQKRKGEEKRHDGGDSAGFAKIGFGVVPWIVRDRYLAAHRMAFNEFPPA